MLQSSHNHSPLLQQGHGTFTTQVNGAIDIDSSRTQSLRSDTQRPHTRTIDTSQLGRTHTRRLVRDRSLRRLGLHRCDALCDCCVVFGASQSSSIASFLALKCSHRSASSFLFLSMTTISTTTTTTFITTRVYLVNSIVVIGSSGCLSFCRRDFKVERCFQRRVCGLAQARECENGPTLLTMCKLMEVMTMIMITMMMMMLMISSVMTSTLTFVSNQQENDSIFLSIYSITLI
jgi:hypothetical protein